ncbi:MAG: hypothetical protein A2104_00750 [Candidatus Melainabacteria bacterium GWF2_32_7]|nr:MAG: hypothetical protein A2104_00750 [Candidatus Melainabacteria bacterium GWF2_32_7]
MFFINIIKREIKEREFIKVKINLSTNLYNNPINYEQNTHKLRVKQNKVSFKGSEDPFTSKLIDLASKLDEQQRQEFKQVFDPKSIQTILTTIDAPKTGKLINILGVKKLHELMNLHKTTKIEFVDDVRTPSAPERFVSMVPNHTIRKIADVLNPEEFRKIFSISSLEACANSMMEVGGEFQSDLDSGEMKIWAVVDPINAINKMNYNMTFPKPNMFIAMFHRSQGDNLLTIRLSKRFEHGIEVLKTAFDYLDPSLKRQKALESVTSYIDAMYRIKLNGTDNTFDYETDYSKITKKGEMKLILENNEEMIPRIKTSRKDMLIDFIEESLLVHLSDEDKVKYSNTLKLLKEEEF